jgi:hypothetical protein
MSNASLDFLKLIRLIFLIVIIDLCIKVILSYFFFPSFPRRRESSSYGAQAGAIARVVDNIEIEAGYRYLMETGDD